LDAHRMNDTTLALIIMAATVLVGWLYSKGDKQ
jgi:hypothetical protein